MVYGTSIKLPGEFFDTPTINMDPQNFVAKLQQHMAELKPLKSPSNRKQNIFVHKDLKSCSHVFLRIDRVKKALEPPYEGPYTVHKKYDKYFTILIKDKTINISVDRLKPAYLLAVDNQNEQTSVGQKNEISNWKELSPMPDEQSTTSCGRKIKNHLRTPAQLQFSLGNVKEKWRKWRQELENYLLATEKDDQTDKIKIAILLNLLGSEGFEIYNTFKLESKAIFSEVLQKFEEYCLPRQNVVYERYKFFSCVQLTGQTTETYVTQLKTLASTCEFSEQENGLIRDRIVLGIKDSGLLELLLRENNLNIKKAIETVRAAEASREQIRNMKYDTATINFVKKNQKKPKTQYNCKKCGRKHKPREYPAFGKICAMCKKKNHFAAKCFQSTKNIHEMNVPENELVYIDSVNENETKCAMKNSTYSNFKNVEMLIEQYKDVFTGVGEFPNEPYHITLKDNAVPVIHPPRRVPLALQPKLKSTLDRLEKEGIVSKVNKPTDWVQSLVIVENLNGNLRLCLDPRDLNKDIIVAGCDEDSHDAIMSRVFERAKLLNIKFNPDKLQYRVSEVKYVGQIISKSGIKPDPDHIKAIVEMPTPKSKTEVRRLLGMVNFLSKFIPNVSKVTAPLREIIHENVEFNWGKEQKLSFVNIKELLAKAPILKVFSVNDEIVMQCDSSKMG
ncbi:transposon Tf2-9 polyprotein [Trichonephila clavipes]|nr:transposon Tf2-9 polyprotein [Trichonephila clavipes]